MIRFQKRQTRLPIVLMAGIACAITPFGFRSSILEQAHAQSASSPLQATSGQLLSALGALNAAHANSEAFANAAPQSEVGKISAYDKAMLAALALPTATPAEVAYQEQQISLDRSTYLVSASNKPLSPAVVAKVDSLLGLPATDPSLGIVPTVDTLPGNGHGIGQNGAVEAVNVGHGPIDHPHIDHPDVQRPVFSRPNIERPNINRPNIPH
jgi:hypothetical protein